MGAKSYKYYYYDELNDDFANNGMEGGKTPSDYEYLPTNILYRFFKPIVYYIVIWLFMIVAKTRGLGIYGERAYARRKNQEYGFFIYGNHTSFLNDAVSGPLSALPRQTYTIVNPDAISITGIRTLVRFMGALPTPNSFSMYTKLLYAIDRLYYKGCAIAIYPEAHIWPKYNKIRRFSPVSFKYPAKLGAPCYSKTTVYKRHKNGKITTEVYIDGPFYPDMSLPFKQRQIELCNKIYSQMDFRVNIHKSYSNPRYQYVKVDSPSEVRTDVSSILP